uniref:PawS-like protein 1a n=1 Tax=Echinacea purpurea TaxID=53751 RepID=A0A1V0JB59_ECHPU|nr:PawS-like protein 1a [Echinacea purpurea]
MAKLALFALTFTAVVAFSSVSAYRTTIITVEDNGIVPVIIDGLDNPWGRRQIPIEQLNHCQMHLTQGIRRPFQQQQQQQHLQQCCSQLKQVDPQYQCDAIQQVFAEARVQGGRQAVSQIASKAQRLPNDCGLEVQQCPLAVPQV